MISLSDIMVDFTDDIVIDGEDILVESDIYINAFRNAQRRVSASQTDFVLTNEIAANLETFLQDRISELTLSDIELNIRLALTQYRLFLDKEFSVILDQDDTKLYVTIVFKLPFSTSSTENSFSVFIDKINQKSYR